jgi:excisionase family DNA binding protein
MMNHIPDRVLNCKEAAARLGVSLRTLDRIAADGRLSKIQLSPGRVGFRERDLADWIASRAAKSAA